jgi:uncharacterized protein with HEPN domain
MLDEVIFDRLQLIVEHVTVICQRVIVVNKSWHAIGPDEKSALIDSLIVRLQALSENIKKIQKLDMQFFESELSLNITPIIRFRDLASHHYEKLEEEIILAICKKDVPHLSNTIQTYLRKLE